MSFDSQHMQHPLPEGMIRGLVQAAPMDVLFALSDEELRLIDPMHTGQTKYADYQYLYFYIKHNCVVVRAAEDLNNTSLANFRKRLSRINVADFAAVLDGYRKYRGSHNNLREKPQRGRHKLKAYITVKDAVNTINTRQITIKGLMKHIDGDMTYNTTAGHVKTLCNEGLLELCPLKVSNGAFAYERTVLCVITHLEERGAVFAIKDNTLQYQPPKGELHAVAMPYLTQHVREIMPIIRERM
jgi:hypothetical protein